MAQLLRQPGFIRRGLFIASLITLPASGFFIWLCLVYLAVPYLLNSGHIISIYLGFHIQYPYPHLIGAVHNLRCRTNGVVIADGFSYSCRFSMKPSNVELFIQQMKLVSTPNDHCIQRLAERRNQLSERSWFPPAPWWKPLDLVGGKCYAKGSSDYTILFYSPTSQIAYINDSDY